MPGNDQNERHSAKSSSDQIVTGAGPSRRAFIVTIGAATLGNFNLPEIGSSAAAHGPTPELAAKVRRLLTPPVKKTSGDGFILVWMEDDESGNGSPTVMSWQPETPEEFAEATRFYEAALGYQDAPDAVEAREGFLGKLKRSFSGMSAQKRSPAEKALLESIIDAPKDETRWLMYADFLEKRKDPLGQFIRVVKELDRFEEGDPRRKPLDKQWNELLDKHAKKWLKGLADLGLKPVLMGNYVPAVWLIEGMVTELEIDKPGILPKRAVQLFEAAPLLLDLRINCDQVEIPELVRLPQVAQLRSLELQSRDLTDEELTAIAHSPNLRRLKTLDLNYNKLTPASIRILVDSPLFKHLTALRIGRCECGDETIRRLSESPNSQNLDELDISGNELTSVAARALAESPYLSRLRTLDISDNSIGVEGLTALCGASCMPHLLALNLEKCEIGDGGGAILGAGGARSLKTLNLASNGLTADDTAAIASGELLSTVEELNINFNKLESASAAHLARCGKVGRLKKLEMSWNQIEDEGAIALSEWAGPVGLKELGLIENGIGPKGATALVRSRLLEQVTSLHVTDNPIGAEGIAAILNSPYLQKLQSLMLTSGSVKGADLKRLEQRFGENVVSA